MRKNGVDVNCPQCQKPTYKKRSHLLKGWHFCSRECWYKYKTGTKLSAETRKKLSEANREEKAYNWKGEKAGYQSKHQWVRKYYGKASYCSDDPSHVSKRYEWANISRKYKRDISDWKQLCISCHRKFDITDETRRKLSIANSRPRPSRRKAIRGINENGDFFTYPSVTEAARALNIHRTGISSCLVGRGLTAGKLKWSYINE